MGKHGRARERGHHLAGLGEGLEIGDRTAFPEPFPHLGTDSNEVCRMALSGLAGGVVPWYQKVFGAMDAGYISYMREEWGFPKRGERALFEKLSLEGQQAGLSWRTILAKREAYRAAFRDFDVDAVAAMGDADIDELLARPGQGTDVVIRHRGKLGSIVNNARCVVALRESWERRSADSLDALDDFLWSFVDFTPQLTSCASPDKLPTSTPVAEAMSKELKRRGFKFVGPVMCYSLMQSCGLVIDHPVGTPEHDGAKRRLAREGRSWVRESSPPPASWDGPPRPKRRKGGRKSSSPAAGLADGRKSPTAG